MYNKDITYTRSEDSVLKQKLFFSNGQGESFEIDERFIENFIMKNDRFSFTQEEMELLIKLVSGYGFLYMPLIAKLIKLKETL
jgi:hypothetical protein